MMSHKPVPQDESESKNALLIEGGREYLQACNAVAEFRRIVQSYCKATLQKYLPQMNAAMGTDLCMERSKVSGRPETFDDPRSRGLWATIGWQLKLYRTHDYLDLYIWWNPVELPDQVGVGVSFRLWNRESMLLLSPVLQTAGFMVSDPDYEIYLMREITPTQMPQLIQYLEELAVELITKCEKVEGLHGLLQKRGRTE
jgi:hypothetical protein